MYCLLFLASDCYENGNISEACILLSTLCYYRSFMSLWVIYFQALGKYLRYTLHHASEGGHLMMASLMTWM